jgi:hypothetical protein
MVVLIMAAWQTWILETNVLIWLVEAQVLLGCGRPVPAQLAWRLRLLHMRSLNIPLPTWMLLWTVRENHPGSSFRSKKDP